MPELRGKMLNEYAMEYSECFDYVPEPVIDITMVIMLIANRVINELIRNLEEG